MGLFGGSGWSGEFLGSNRFIVKSIFLETVMVESSAGGVLVRLYPKDSDAESQDREEIPADEREVEPEKFPDVSLGQALALLECVKTPISGLSSRA